MVRGIARQQTRNLGNFWVDLTRITLYLFIPICLVFALLNVWQGIPMNYRPYTQATTLDQSAAAADKPAQQPIVQGPMAAYAAPKVLGLNGPGILRRDCAHPFENPTPLSEFLQLLLFFSVIAGLPYYYGRMINHRLHGWNIWLIMFGLLIVTNLITWYCEAQPNPRMTVELRVRKDSAMWRADKSFFMTFRSRLALASVQLTRRSAGALIKTRATECAALRSRSRPSR